MCFVILERSSLKQLNYVFCAFTAGAKMWKKHLFFFLKWALRLPLIIREIIMSIIYLILHLAEIYFCLMVMVFRAFAKPVMFVRWVTLEYPQETRVSQYCYCKHYVRINRMNLLGLGFKLDTDTQENPWHHFQYHRGKKRQNKIKMHFFQLRKWENYLSSSLP